MSLSLLRRLPPARPPLANLVARPGAAWPQDRPRQGALVLGLLAAVVVLDQAAKWWAWRHVPWAEINSGGDMLTGPTIGAWYAHPVPGALLDLLDVGLLSAAVSVLARRRASVAVLPGTLMTAGWGSNLLDRLGVHYWTAPGSVRGVVDFIHVGGQYYNVADLFIIGGTPLFLLAAGYRTVQAVRRPAATGSVSAVPRARAQARARLWGSARVLIPALAGAGLVLAVALGAANYGGVTAAPAHAGARNGGHACPNAAGPLPAC